MRSVILGFALVAPVLLVVAWPFSPWFGLALLFVSHALVLIPTLSPNVQWLGPVVTRFETGGREVWLTIDDGPSDDTREILDVLDAAGARATFFVKGTLARERRDLVLEILRRGHSVDNHSLTHPSGSFWCLPPARIRREIEEGATAVEEITGRPSRWFRSPVGMKNPFVHPALARRNLRLIGWTIRGFDSLRDRAEEVAARIVRHIEPGAILVLHQGRPWSARTIRAVVEAVKANGYSFVIPDDGRLKTKR